MSHWIQHKIVFNYFKQNLLNKNLVFWLIWEYCKKKEQKYHLLSLKLEKKLKGRFWECLLYYYEGRKYENEKHQNSDNLSCLAYTQEIHNLKLKTHSFVIYAAGFYSIHYCWQESGWNFDEDWTTIDKVQNQRLPITSPFSACLRIKRFLNFY